MREILNGLSKALSYGGSDTHTIQDVLDATARGDAQLWFEDDAVIVTEVEQHPRCKSVHFWLATGKKDAVIALSHKILAWAKEQGCTRATLAGRRGWLRVLAKEGWKSVPLTLMQKDL